MRIEQKDRKTTSLTETLAQVPAFGVVTPMTKNIKPGFKIYSRPAKGTVSTFQVGVVDCVDGDHYLKLTKSDSSDGKHHWIPLGWVEKADTKSAYLNRTQAEFNHGQLNEFPKSSIYH